MATYPGALPNLTESIPATPGTTTLGTSTATRTHSGHHTQIAQELGAALAELGTNPKGSDASVKARLDRMQGEIDAVGSGGGAIVVQDWTTPGTYTDAAVKPAGAKGRRIRIVAGGASGQGGGRVNGDGASGGGGGGGGGSGGASGVGGAGVAGVGVTPIGGGSGGVGTRPARKQKQQSDKSRWVSRPGI